MGTNKATFRRPLVIQENIYYIKRARGGVCIHQAQSEAYLDQNWNRVAEMQGIRMAMTAVHKDFINKSSDET